MFDFIEIMLVLTMLDRHSSNNILNRRIFTASVFVLLFCIRINIYKTDSYKNDPTGSMEFHSNLVTITQNIRTQINTNK